MVAGAVEVTAPGVNNKRVDPATGERLRFCSATLPPWYRWPPRWAACGWRSWPPPQSQPPPLVALLVLTRDRPRLTAAAQQPRTHPGTVVTAHCRSFPATGYAPLSLTAGTGAVRIAGAGALPDDGFSGYRAFGGFELGRWGDYSAAADGR